MRILGIDPGSRCGWALQDQGRVVASGTWDLGARRHEGGGMRYLRLESYLNQIHAAHRFGAVAYEEVRRHLGTDAAHIYGGIVATVGKWCEERKVPYRGIPVGAIKKAATGKGNAKKEAMIEAARAKWPSVLVEDDNHADALWVAECLAQELGAALALANRAEQARLLVSCSQGCPIGGPCRYWPSPCPEAENG